jgi:hypothetical protein
LILAVLATFAGCLAIADFPEELLGDGGRKDAATADTAADVGSTDQLAWCTPGGCTAAAAPICDTGTHQCRACKGDAECAKEGKGAFCRSGQCAKCKPGECTGPAPFCDTSTGLCTMKCKDDQECVEANLGDKCNDSNVCQACVTDGDCETWGKGELCDATATPKWCRYCQSNKECQTAGKGLICDMTVSPSTCRGCKTNAECQSEGKGLICETASGTCRICKTHQECQDEGKGLFCDSAGCRSTCNSDAECVAAKQDPFCDKTTSTCRTCNNHAECGAGKVCDHVNETCLQVTGTLKHVNCSSSCPGSGTATSPYCSLSSVLTDGFIVAVKKSTKACAGLDIKKDIKLYGEPGAVLGGPKCDDLLIDAAKVTISGFTIKPNIKIQNAASKVVLIGNTIGGADCIGVDLTGGGTLNLQRNLIWNNGKGGVHADGKYTIENNFIVKNGDTDIAGGGALLKADPGSSFTHNTVADNKSKTGPDDGAIRCEGSEKVHNSIVLNNAKGLGKNCVGVSNLTKGSPNFEGTGTGADPWHIQLPSDADGQATMAMPPSDGKDYDGETRSTSAPDIGADEIF